MSFVPGNMKNEFDGVSRKLPSPTFSKTAREWILSSALYDGIEDEDIRQIETLLSERGANPNVLLPEYGIAPFHMVVANESTGFAIQATDICLQHGADPNIRSEDGLTPVHLAAMWGCGEVLRLLLASGGDPWLVDILNKNAFEYAQSEGQAECYDILKTHCNSQPKPSSHTKSPFQLNLKRVVLYKNDLQIVYEASPTSSQRCASTQTSPTATKTKTNVMPMNFNYLNKYSKTSTKETSPEKVNNHSRREIKEYVPVTLKSPHKKIALKVNNKNLSSEINESEMLSSRLKEVIISHRRNSEVFECSPQCQERDESASSGVASWKDVESSREKVSKIASELIEKLEKTNRFRQTLKLENDPDKMLRNVTRRKKLVETPTTPKNANGERTTMESLQDSPLLNEIGFVLNDSVAKSAMLTRRRESSVAQNIESPPSIGFILDNLEDDVPGTRGSSLFSDIDSDAEVFASGKIVTNNANIMTEDESFSDKQSTKLSTSDSLYPCVSCDDGNTREEESSEGFESCLDKEKSNVKSSSKQIKETSFNTEYMKTSTTSVASDVHSVLDSILDNVDENKRTPLNPNLITSTPERLSAGGSENADSMFTTAIVSEMERRKWVNAEIVSSSSDEEKYMSISEEYEYTDMDEGVVLIERRYLLNDINLSEKGIKKKKQKPSAPNSTTEESEVSTISGSEGAYDTDELRKALRVHGFTPGPINSHTKRVYLRKLKRVRHKPDPPPPLGQPAYSPELLRTLNNTCEHLLHEWAHLEDSMAASFSCSRRPWREGQAKTSFTYLLLDPRFAHSLPARAASMPNSSPFAQLWSDFLRAVFYVGKGKRARPYAHLYSAVSAWQSQQVSTSKKIQRILDIWHAEDGVICLHVFMNIIPVEAFTREAAMISALTLNQLTNEKTGEFYGSAACWNVRLKRRLGCVLLYRAFRVYLAEGERQLRPVDID